AKRTGIDVPGKRQALDTAKTNLATARGDVQAAKTTQAGLLGTWVASTVTPATEIGRLDCSQPIVFLPVRIETRFALAQGKLRIRVYPDDIFGHTHEEAVTEAELADAQRFQEDGQDLPAWQGMLRRRTPERAAWVMDRFAENVDAGKVDTWTLP